MIGPAGYDIEQANKNLHKAPSYTMRPRTKVLQSNEAVPGRLRTKL